uniref:Putative ionotropic receptor ligand binding domain-containing protein n=1 Tax=Musca domestica TaxID=7370 RepID=A0A1I8MPE7_MUSDO
MNHSAFLLSYEQRQFMVKQDDRINQFVAKALRFLIQNVFETLTSTYAVFISSRDLPSLHWLNYIMMELFSLTTAMTVQIVLINVKQKATFEMRGRKYCNIILVDSYQSLLDIGLASNNANFDGLEYYLIFLQARDNVIPREMELIFQYCLDNYWLHCNVMIQTAKGEVLMYTYFPYTAEECYKAKPLLIDYFDGVQFQNSPLFPHKLYNLHKCPLVVNTWPQPPYVGMQYFENGTLHYFGMDINLLNALSEEMNFTLKFEMRDVERILYAIDERKVNMSTSYTRRSVILDRSGSSTVTTYHTTLVAVIIRSPYPLTSIRTLVFPFDTDAWICLLCTLLAMITINQMRRHSNSMTNLQFIEIFLGLSTLYRPRLKWHSLSFLIWLWCSFLLRSIYQSMIFYLYNFDIFQNPPKSLDALVEHGFTLICTRKTLQFVENIPQVANNMLRKIIFDSSDEMQQLVHLDRLSERNYAAIVDKEIAKFYINNMKPKNILQILPFTVNNIPTTIYLPKHSFLIETINDNILRIFGAGLHETWTLYNGAEDYPKNDEPQRTMFDMSFIHVFSVLELSLILYFVSFVIFLLELCSRKLKCLQKLFEKVH